MLMIGISALIIESLDKQNDIGTEKYNICARTMFSPLEMALARGVGQDCIQA